MDTHTHRGASLIPQSVRFNGVSKAQMELKQLVGLVFFPLLRMCVCVASNPNVKLLEKQNINKAREVKCTVS